MNILIIVLTVNLLVWLNILAGVMISRHLLRQMRVFTEVVNDSHVQCLQAISQLVNTKIKYPEVQSDEKLSEKINTLTAETELDENQLMQNL